MFKLNNTFYTITYILNLIGLLITIFYTGYLAIGLAYTKTLVYIKLLSYCICLTFILVLYVYYIITNKEKRGRDKYFSMSLSCTGYSLFFIGIIAAFSGSVENKNIIYLSELLSTAFSVFSYYFFWKYTLEYLEKNNFRKIITHVLLFVNIVTIICYAISPFNELAYYFDSNYNVIYTMYIDLICLIIYFLFYLISVLSSNATKKIKLTLSSFCFSIAFYLIACALLFDNDITIYFEGAQQNYEFLSLLIVFLNTYSNDKDELVASKAKETELQTSIMISQIQPHFLYNALTAIRVLYRNDSEEGEKTLIDFANYLRVNMESIKQGLPISFKKEINHTKTYLSIEKKRFGELLNIEYDIQYDDFYLPPLTIQPLVENAVNHGIRQNENGGTVKISSYKNEDLIYVVVEDDGSGFDTNIIDSNEIEHIALDNIKTRIENQINGKLIIESETGKGTKATIIIKGDKDECIIS